MAMWHLESVQEKQKKGEEGLLLTSSFGCLAPRIHVGETKRGRGRGLLLTSLFGCQVAHSNVAPGMGVIRWIMGEGGRGHCSRMRGSGSGILVLFLLC